MANSVQRSLVLGLLLLLADSSSACSDEDSWEPYRFLVGEWVGEGSGQPGKGSGDFSFGFDLQGKILVRKNHAEFPAASGRPALAHDDLMVTYHAGGDGPMKAIYFDSEG